MSQSCLRRPWSLSRRVSMPSAYQSRRTSLALCSKRNLRCVSKKDISIEDELKILKNSVAFQNIDKRGSTQRFYREVFIEPAVPGSENTFPGWTVCLDNRKLLLNGELVVLDDYRLALCVANEWESQGTEIRPDSMPVCELVFSYLEKRQAIDQRLVPEDMSLRSCKSSVTQHIDSDLILIAENPELAEQGWYERHWDPLVQWVNQTFDCSLRIKYMLMHGEEDDEEVVQETMQPGAIAAMNTQDLLNAYKETEIAQRMQFMLEKKDAEQALNQPERRHGNNREYLDSMMSGKGKKNSSDTIDMSPLDSNQAWVPVHQRRKSHLSNLKQFVKDLDFTRLWVMDHCIQYCYSPIISLALVLNACPISGLTHALNCPELDTHMISLDEESLKRNQTQLKLAAARVFMDSIDRMKPMPPNYPFVSTYPKPVIQIDNLKHPKYQREKMDFH